jgi:hypothetical protein
MPMKKQDLAKQELDFNHWHPLTSAQQVYAGNIQGIHSHHTINDGVGSRMLVSFDHLMQLAARDDFTESSSCGSFKPYISL